MPIHKEFSFSNLFKKKPKDPSSLAFFPAKSEEKAEDKTPHRSFSSPGYVDYAASYKGRKDVQEKLEKYLKKYDLELIGFLRKDPSIPDEGILLISRNPHTRSFIQSHTEDLGVLALCGIEWVIEPQFAT